MTVTALPPRGLPARRSTPRTAARPPAHTAFWLSQAQNATDWVGAAPFAAHLSFLVGESGLHWQVVGDVCGLPPRTTRRLLRLDGPDRPLRRLLRSSAARLLAVGPSDLRRLSTVEVAAEPTSALLAALARLGWDEPRIAATVGARPDQLAAVRERGFCTGLVARQVAAAWYLASGETLDVRPGDFCLDEL